MSEYREYFISPAYRDALSMLATHGSPADGVIVDNYFMAGYVPRFTGKRIFYAHTVMTAYAAQKRAIHERFFEENAEADYVFNILREHNLQYVVFTQPRADQAFDHMPFLQLVYNQDGVKVYRVYEQYQRAEVQSGDLLKGAGETVYLLEGHVRRQIANLEVLEACGLASHPLKGVTETQLLELPAGHPVGEPPYWYDKLLPGPLRTLPLFHAAAKAC